MFLILMSGCTLKSWARAFPVGFMFIFAAVSRLCINHTSVPLFIRTVFCPGMPSSSYLMAQNPSGISAVS